MVLRFNEEKTQRFFLRAESFYNFASEVQKLIKDNHFVFLYQFYRKIGKFAFMFFGATFLKLV